MTEAKLTVEMEGLIDLIHKSQLRYLQVYQGGAAACGHKESAAYQKAESGVRAALTAIIEERDRAVTELKEADDSSDAMDLKLKALAPHGTCGCSYDRPTDLCMHHSPKLAETVADRDALALRVKELEGAFKDIWQIKYKDSAQLSMIACYYCGKKQPEIETPFEHGPDCIIRRIRLAKSPSEA